jgi:hypothetical protein
VLFLGKFGCVIEWAKDKNMASAAELGIECDFKVEGGVGRCTPLNERDEQFLQRMVAEGVKICKYHNRLNGGGFCQGACQLKSYDRERAELQGKRVRV